VTELVSIRSDKLEVAVSPFGAELQSVMTSDGASWLWDGDEKWWSGRAPLLFPIVGGAPNDTVEIDGKLYGLKRHGFARKSAFRLVEQSVNSCVFELNESEDTLVAYPFKFKMRVTYSIEGSQLTNSVEIYNTNDCDMPFGFGFHPAFKWPLPQAQNLPHFITLENGGEPDLMRVDQTGLFIDEKLPSPFEKGKLELDHSQYVDDALVFPEGAGNALTYGPENGPKLRFEFENLPNLALWQKPGAPYICIEPWHGMAAINGKGADIMARPSTRVLSAGEMAKFGYSVEISS